MKTEFSNPPMVELIAELRWIPAGARTSSPGNIDIPAHMLAPGTADAFFMSFASGIGGEGFTRSERLTPPGFPSIPYQPAYRYTKAVTEPGMPIFQLGLGLFSAHITPPYKKWDDFRPFLEKGVKVLLQSRDASDRARPFFQAMVRYLDCFTEEFTEGRHVRDFLKSALGIGIEVPDFLEQEAGSKPISPAIQLSVPLRSGATMNLSIGNGKIGSRTGIVMDSSVIATRETAPDQESIMKFLDDAHGAASSCFVKMTRPIHSTMGVVR